jgi:hypothetical protein
VSFAVDVNVLLYASDRSSPFSTRAMEFLGRCAEGAEVWCIAWPTVMGYLRMVTHPAICREPLSPEAAMQNVEGLLRLPHVRTLGEDERFWDVYKDVVGGVPARGNLVPDAHVAALLRLHGVGTLYTNDRGFRRFEFLTVRDPFEPA